MPTYRRWRLCGGCYFFTVNLSHRGSDLLVQRIDLFRKAVADVRARHACTIDAAVVLPDHLHMVWTLPAGDSDFSMRWRLIKSQFTAGMSANAWLSPSRRNKHEKGIWQRRFYEHLIRDQGDLNRHVDYIHYNPVKHGYVDRPVDWPHSSLHRYITRGILAANWGTNQAVGDLDIE